MTPVEDAVREILSGLQSARVYFAGHGRVSASAEAVHRAARELDPEKGLLLGLHGDALVHDGQPLHEASKTATALIEALRAWQAEGVYIEPGATEADVAELLGALAFPPVDDPGTRPIRREGVGMLSAGAVQDGLRVPSVDPPSARRLERVRLGRRATCAMLSRTMEDLDDDMGMDLDDIGAAARDMAELIGDTPEAALSLVSMKGQDTYTFTHTVNVTVLALVAARPYVRDLDALLRLAQAALLHDVGKVAVPHEVLYKQGSYTPEEWEQMRLHPVRGAEILSATTGVDDLAVMAAFGHHLRIDGSGYPRLCVPFRPHPFVGILSIADVYEALTAERPYKKRMPPHQAMEVIVKEAGRQFEARLVRAFARSIGMFPVGTWVRLSNGLTGLVAGNDPDNLPLPRVRILEEDGAEDGGRLVDLATKESRERALRVAGVLDRPCRIEDLVASFA